MEERFQTEVWCRRRGKGESLRGLVIRRLMALAYPRTMSALDDPEFEVKIRDREPADTIRYDTMEDFTCDQKLANSLICRTEPNKKD